MLTERSGHTNDDGIDFANLGEVRAGAKGTVVHCLSDIRRSNVFDKALLCIQSVDFRLIHVETDNFDARTGEL